MSNTIILVFLLFVIIGAAVGIFGYVTDWTFQLTSLDTSETLGCLNPSQELKDAYPHASTFKANFERTKCIPSGCNVGYSLDENTLECKITLEHVGCYRATTDDVIELTKDNLFFIQGGSSQDTSLTQDLSLLTSGTPVEIAEFFISDKMGYVSREITGFLTRKPKNYNYIGFYKDKTYIFNTLSGFVQLDEQYCKEDDNGVIRGVETQVENRLLLSVYKMPAATYENVFDSVSKITPYETNKNVDGYTIKRVGDVEKGACSGSKISGTSRGLFELPMCKQMCDDNPSCKAFNYFYKPVYTTDQSESLVPENINDYFEYNDFYVLKNNCELLSDQGDFENTGISRCYLKD